MNEVKIKKELAKLAKKYEKIKSVSFSYQGSGDSFDSYDVDIEPYSEKVKSLINSEIEENESLGKELMGGVNSSDFEDIFWEMVEEVGSDFNNEGSQGTVVFNLKDKTIKITDYYNVMTEELNQEIEI